MKLANIKLVALSVAIALTVLTAPHRVKAAETQVAIVAGGCFWCVEADFEKLRGVSEVVSGYTGGTTRNPTYKQVSRGGTGHYEAVQIFYDPDRLSYEQILHMFMRSIDPLDAGGQFCDRGESYRTAIFPSNPAEKAAADAAIADARSTLGRDIATKVLDAATFYEAEDYHQDYYKGSKLILTRAGPKRQSEAYKFYRDACKRDERVREVWGDAAPFAGS